MLHVGVIGCGKIAQTRHLPEYMAHPGVCVSGLFDLNAERAADLAARYHASAYESYQALLADPQIDAVSVCTANASHAEIACAALEQGKHVLCEKPMATTLADCERMVACAKHNKRYLMIDQNQRLAAAHIKARQLLRAGAIGRVLSFRTSFGHGGPERWSIDGGAAPRNLWFFDQKRAAMGALADLGLHKTDLIQFLTGQTIIEVTAVLDTLDKKDGEGRPISVEDNAFAIYRLDGGAIGTMTASWTHYGREDNSTVLYGSEGMLRIYDGQQHALVLIGQDGAERCYDAEAIQTNENQTDSGIIERFVACVEHPELAELTGESVLKAMRAVFACLESSRTGRGIRVNE